MAGSDLQSDDEREKHELVDYVHGNRTVSRAELLGEGLNDGKPPMRVRLVETGRTIRADVDRVLRGGEMREQAELQSDDEGEKLELVVLCNGIAWRVYYLVKSAFAGDGGLLFGALLAKLFETPWLSIL